MTHEKSKTTAMQIWGGGGVGVREVYYGVCESRELKLSQRVREYFVTLIKSGMYLITCNPEYI